MNSCEEKRKVIVWSLDILNVFSETRLIGGITVQLFHWVNVFNRNGWQVYSLTENPSKKKGGINFVKLWRFRYFNIILQPLVYFFLITKIRPTAIIFRGASRNILCLQLICKIYGISFIFMLASDTDVKKGQELIKRPWDRWLYRRGLEGTNVIICQNTDQTKNLKKNYNKNAALLIPNIWPNSYDHTPLDTRPYEHNTILWVGNFRTLKRPRWFLEIAKSHPTKRFIMIGGVLDKSLYEDCKVEAESIPNLTFLGPKSLKETARYFENARMFICTSEIEGFPNTFLQAWSNRIPVISTFDPSGVIEKYSLGYTAGSIDEISTCITALDNKTLLESFESNITKYFIKFHNDEQQFRQLLRFV